jgi:DNA-binding IclR family transcriptional regulator
MNGAREQSRARGAEVKSAVRVLEILELLARAREPVPLREVAAELGYPRSSTHALLQTLVARGYATKNGHERYALEDSVRHGPGWIDRAEAQLLAAARPVMEEMRDRLGETVFLGVRLPTGDVRRLEKCVSRQPVRYDTDRTTPAPAYCTAMGRTLLAHWDPVSLRRYLARVRLVAHTPLTVTDPDKLVALLARIRKQGHAVVDQEYVVGGIGVAAPVRDRAGAVVAVLNIGAVVPRFASARAQLIEGVKLGAAQVSRRLGYRPETAG